MGFYAAPLSGNAFLRIPHLGFDEGQSTGYCVICMKLWCSFWVGLTFVLVGCSGFAQGFFTKTVPITFSPPKGRLMLTNVSSQRGELLQLDRDLRGRIGGGLGSPAANLSAPAPAPKVRAVVRKTDPVLNVLQGTFDSGNVSKSGNDQFIRELEFQIVAGSSRPMTPQQRQIFELLDQELRGVSQQSVRDEGKQLSSVESALREFTSVQSPIDFVYQDSLGNSSRFLDTMRVQERSAFGSSSVNPAPSVTAGYFPQPTSRSQMSWGSQEWSSSVYNGGSTGSGKLGNWERGSGVDSGWEAQALGTIGTGVGGSPYGYPSVSGPAGTTGNWGTNFGKNSGSGRSASSLAQEPKLPEQRRAPNGLLVLPKPQF